MRFFDGVGRLLFAFTKQSGDSFLAPHPYFWRSGRRAAWVLGVPLSLKLVYT